MRRRYAFPSGEETSRAFGLGKDGRKLKWVARYNVAPGDLVPILMATPGGTWKAAHARWGLIPSWWRGPGVPQKTYSVDLTEAPSRAIWGVPFRQHRCLIPALGWYEWKKLHDTPRGGVVREPHFFCRDDEQVMGLAGLMSVWKGAEGDQPPVVSVAMLQGPAPRGATPIAKRMPLPLSPDIWSAWLSAGEAEPKAITSMALQVAVPISHRKVSHRVYHLRHDDVGLTLPAAH